MKRISILVYRNKKAKEGEPVEWINLREIWLKAEYKIPYHRWALYQLKNFNIAPKMVKQKTGGKGQPRKLYYIPANEAEHLIRAIERRRHIEISIIRKK